MGGVVALEVFGVRGASIFNDTCAELWSKMNFPDIGKIIGGDFLQQEYIMRSKLTKLENKKNYRNLF